MQITPKLKFSNKQHIAFDALTKNKNINEILFGGAKNGGKSYLGVSWLVSSSIIYGGIRSFIARRELNDLKKYTMPSIYEFFTKTGINFTDECNFNNQTSTFDFRNGSKIYLIQCPYLPSDPLYERFGSMQMTMGWIEEGGEIHSGAYENLKLSIGRWLNDQFNIPHKLLITANPKKNWLYHEFYKPFKDGTLPKNKMFIQSLVTDNIFRQSGSIEILDAIKDPIAKARLRFGEWEYSDDPNALMDNDSIMSIFTNSYVLEQGQKYITADVARFGNDKTKIRVWHGLKVIRVVSIDKSSTVEVAKTILKLVNEYRIPMHHVVIDEDGIGGGVVDQLPGCKGFIANSSPINPAPNENYINLKTQCAYKIAELINDGMVYEPITNMDDRDRLVADLTTIREKNVDGDGKRAIISKDQVKQILGRSPDDGDTYIMRAFFELKKTTGFKVIQPMQMVSNGRTNYSM